MLTYWQAARIVVLGYGAFLLGSSAGGLAVDYWAFRRTGESRHAALRRVLGLNTLEWLSLGLLAALAAVVVLAGDGAPLAMTLAWISVVPACIAAAIWVSSPSRAGRLSTPPPRPPVRERSFSAGLAKLGRLSRQGLADAIGGVVLVRRIVSRPWRHPMAVTGFPAYWAGDLLVLYAALRAFGVEAGIAALVLAYATGYVSSALPLPAGGAGGVDSALTFSLYAVGIPLGPALLATLCYRAFTLWLPLLPALALGPAIASLHDELPRVGREGDAAG